ncbi:hypothetical protein B0A49_01383 [Cryomyces minteri]|uniref:RING-type domain-containing protein n=1 Tax=Cryomyces minteri TaxID=331657 RepID=A0A4U0XR06_9PEZI|nr:hypothetical protein B0A49_01383 [Cryomyces minteri]
MSSRSTTPSAVLPSYDEFVESGLTPVSIAALPASADTSCAICRTEYTAADGVCVPTRLACGHIMGEECLFEWWERGDSNTCPLCRRELFRREPSVEQEQEGEEDGGSWEPVLDTVGSGFPGLAAWLPHMRAAMSRRAAAEEALPAEVLARFEARERDEQRDFGPPSGAELATADEEEAGEAEAEAEARTEEERAREEAVYQRWRLRRLLETLVPPAQPYQHHGVQYRGLRG